MSGKLKAPTAEKLMRSRYSAHSHNNSLYLLQTAHPFEPTPPTVNEAVQKTIQQIQWQRLEIILTEKGAPHDSEGVVEYKAFYTMAGHPFFLHEKAFFKKIDGEWKYTDGELIS